VTAVETANDAAQARAARCGAAVLASLGDTVRASGATPGASRASPARSRAPAPGGGAIDASLEARPLTLPQRLRQWLDRAAGWLLELLQSLGRCGAGRTGARKGALRGS